MAVNNRFRFLRVTELREIFFGLMSSVGLCTLYRIVYMRISNSYCFSIHAVVCGSIHLVGHP